MTTQQMTMLPDDEMPNRKTWQLTYEDVLKRVKYQPARFCQYCGTQLEFAAGFDCIGRPYIKEKCRNGCNIADSIPLTEESFHKGRLAKWTKEVKERENNECAFKNEMCGGPLHAHHIIPKSADPSLAYDTNNGICVCEKHHQMIHEYMKNYRRNNNNV